MQINAALNLVFPVRFGEEQQPDPKNPSKTVTAVVPLVWAYAIPISQEVFRANYRVIAAAKDQLFRKGVAIQTSLAIADAALLEAARADAESFDTEDVGQALLAEIRRLTTIIVSGPNGFEYVPPDQAIKQNVISEDDWHDAECAIIFFTCIYSATPRLKRDPLVNSLASMLQGSTTSLKPTEFAASLQTSNRAETSEAPAPSSATS